MRVKTTEKVQKFQEICTEKVQKLKKYFLWEPWYMHTYEPQLN